MKRATISVFLFSVGGFAGCVGGSGGGGPELCVPDTEVEPVPTERNPECEACVSQNCAPQSDCDAPCESYYACTCECDGEDQACFAACGDERTPSCEQCTDASGEALISCVQTECAAACLGGVGGGDGADDGGGGFDDGDDGDDGGFDDGDDGGFDDGDDGFDDDGGSGDGSAACEELHGNCCPMLSGIDRDLCESATDETGCEIWLDIFRDEGSC